MSTNEQPMTPGQAQHGLSSPTAYHEIYRANAPEHCVKVVNFGCHAAGLHAVAQAAIAAFKDSPDFAPWALEAAKFIAASGRDKLEAELKELRRCNAMNEDAANKGDKARSIAGALEERIKELESDRDKLVMALREIANAAHTYDQMGHKDDNRLADFEKHARATLAEHEQLSEDTKT